MKKTARSRIRLGLEQLEDRITPSAIGDIQMTFATRLDPQTLSINYNILGASLAGQILTFNVYRSSAYNSLNDAQLIGTATIPGSDSADLSLGSHQGVKLTLPTMTPNPALPFIVVVANSSGTIPAQSNSANHMASFETHTLGVIAHGLEIDPTLWWLNDVPAWELQMAAALQQNDGYEAVLPFNWVRLSFLPFPSAIQLAGNQLYQQVVAEADQLASEHPGDVVDIQFIGHSRGTVVISEVLQDLAGTSDPALRGGYMEMTLLDPHPANLVFSQISWDFAIPEVNDFAALVVWFEYLTHDPQVVVPPNVMRTQLFDEQTPAGQLGFSYLSEILLNFWGEKASALPDQSAQPIQELNLTNVTAAGIGLIGHSEVHDWYLANVVDANKTFTYFG